MIGGGIMAGRRSAQAAQRERLELTELSEHEEAELIEHSWAIGLREQVRDSGGVLSADAWIHPSDLVDVGLVTAEDADGELLF
jgi:hypothetical protein